MKDINKVKGNQKSVKSIHSCKSAPEWLRRAGVIQTMYVVIKAHGGELSVGLPSEKVETLSAEAAAQAGKEGEGSEFMISFLV